MYHQCGTLKDPGYATDVSRQIGFHTYLPKENAFTAPLGITVSFKRQYT